MSKQNNRYTSPRSSSASERDSKDSLADTTHPYCTAHRWPNALKEEIRHIRTGHRYQNCRSLFFSVENVSQVYDTQKVLPLGHNNNVFFCGAVGTSTLTKSRFTQTSRHWPSFSTLLSYETSRDWRYAWINISSVGGWHHCPTAVTYCATKFYVSVSPRDSQYES